MSASKAELFAFTCAQRGRESPALSREGAAGLKATPAVGGPDCCQLPDRAERWDRERRDSPRYACWLPKLSSRNVASGSGTRLEAAAGAGADTDQPARGDGL